MSDYRKYMSLMDELDRLRILYAYKYNRISSSQIAIQYLKRYKVSSFTHKISREVVVIIRSDSEKHEYYEHQYPNPEDLSDRINELENQLSTFQINFRLDSIINNLKYINYGQQ